MNVAGSHHEVHTHTHMSVSTERQGLILRKMATADPMHPDCRITDSEWIGVPQGMAQNTSQSEGKQVRADSLLEAPSYLSPSSWLSGTESPRGVPYFSADFAGPLEMVLAHEGGCCTGLTLSTHQQPKVRNVCRPSISTLRGEMQK